MKERRKIFSAADLAAIREGRKTMFREMVGKQKHPFGTWATPDEVAHEFNWGTNAFVPPLGIIGDRLWLPEAHQFLRETCSYECEEYDLFEWEHDLYGSPKDHLLAKCPRGGHRAVIGYAGEEDMEDQEMRPSITMPRWACRTFAEITGVRVERVQEMEGMDAASSDALKEGVHRIHHEGGNYYYSAFRNQPDPKNWTDPYLAFRELWQSRHGNWEANPWVWAYSIKLIKP